MSNSLLYWKKIELKEDYGTDSSTYYYLTEDGNNMNYSSKRHRGSDLLRDGYTHWMKLSDILELPKKGEE